MNIDCVFKYLLSMLSCLCLMLTIVFSYFGIFVIDDLYGRVLITIFVLTFLSFGILNIFIIKEVTGD